MKPEGVKISRGNFYVGFPKSYQEIQTYGAELLAGQAVIINLSSMLEPEQEQCRTFMSGISFATKGKMQEVSSDIILLVPPGMELRTS